jgi:hypothetical protein
MTLSLAVHRSPSMRAKSFGVATKTRSALGYLQEFTGERQEIGGLGP